MHVLRSSSFLAWERIVREKQIVFHGLRFSFDLIFGLDRSLVYLHSRLRTHPIDVITIMHISREWGEEKEREN